MQTLVIGSKGWIGSYLVNYNSSFFSTEIASNLSFVEFRDWINNQNPQCFINCVGKFKGPESEMGWANIGILELILKRAYETGSKVFSLGSAAEYGDLKQNRVKEDDTALPISLYGKQKLIASELLHAYVKKGVNAINLRLFNVIGPKQPSNTALGEILRKLINSKPDTNYILDDYDIIRDFIDLKFISEAINHLNRIDFQGTLNMGSGRPTKLLDIVSEMATNFNIQIKPGTLTATRVQSSVADTNKLAEVGLLPAQYTLTEMSDLIVRSQIEKI
jgi:nucleoside-diphosphate-sugar epimerase